MGVSKEQKRCVLLQCGINDPQVHIFDPVGVTMGEENGDPVQLNQPGFRIGVSIVTVSGNICHGDGRKLFLQLPEIIHTVTQMDDVLRLFQTDGLDHWVKPSVGIGKNQYFHGLQIHLLKFGAYNNIEKGGHAMEQENDRMKQEFQKLMSTPEGRQLIKLLSSDGGRTLREAGAALKNGDQGAVRETMAPVLRDPQVKKLMEAVEKAMNHG